MFNIFKRQSGHRKPHAIAFVDYEHWYISLEKLHNRKPDIKAWFNEISKDYDVKDIIFFADFSNTAIRLEIPKIREVSSTIIETQNASVHHKKDFTDFNTIIYGHNVRNGHMFSELRNYTEQSYYNGAPVIYIATENGIARYDIFAAAEVSTESSAFWLDVENENNRQTFIDQALEASQIETGIVPSSDDKILTLSTCTGNGHATRWVVQAVLAD